MYLLALWSELVRRNRLLTFSGLAYLFLFIILVLVALFDSTVILGINRWIKPMKFAISIAIFQWTMGWLMKHLEARRDKVRLISRGIVMTMLAEIIPIVAQPARGKLSHFNQETAFDAAVFSFMGIMILINTILVLYALVLFFTVPSGLPKAYLWGIRYGMIIFFLASIEGGLIAIFLRHSVGAPDGGPGLPFINWSTQGGDLRVAHFIGLHALQVLPIFGYLIDRNKNTRAVALTTAVAVIYLAITALTFAQALMGRPLIGLE